MEADLARFYGIDYRDRWQRPGSLTLRRLRALLAYLPPDSAVAQLERGGSPHWSLEAHLLDDLRIVLTSTTKDPAKPHALRPRGKKAAPDPARARSLAAARARAAERRRAKESGELT